MTDWAGSLLDEEDRDKIRVGKALRKMEEEFKD